MDICPVCKLRISSDDIDAHFPHDKECSREGWCRCDNEVHPECCWECQE